MNLTPNVVGKLTLLALLLAGCVPEKASDANEVCFKDHCFSVKVAISEKEMARGLQFRTEMAEEEGMIFVFREDKRHSFWMKDTFLSLDMIWLNYNQEVVHIEKEVPPCKEEQCKHYRPKVNARYVLEINSGLTDRIPIKIGDYADIRLQPIEIY